MKISVVRLTANTALRLSLLQIFINDRLNGGYVAKQ